MAKKKQTLGRQMLATLTNITDLMVATTDADRLEELMEQRNRILTQLADLVETNLNQASKEYAAATEGLRGASDAAKEAVKGLKSVAEAITVIARALDLVARLM